MSNETIEEKTYRLLQIANKNDEGVAIDSDFEGEMFNSLLDNTIFKLHCKMIELAIAEEREAFGWRDIASAPKDGSHILLGRCGTDEDCEISTLGWWQEEALDGQDYMGSDAGFVDHEFSSFYPGRIFGVGKYQYKAVQPTHWKHLPAAPKAEVSE